MQDNKKNDLAKASEFCSMPEIQNYNYPISSGGLHPNDLLTFLYVWKKKQQPYCFLLQ